VDNLWIEKEPADFVGLTTKSKVQFSLFMRYFIKFPNPDFTKPGFCPDFLVFFDGKNHDRGGFMRISPLSAGSQKTGKLWITWGNPWKTLWGKIPIPLTLGGILLKLF